MSDEFGDLAERLTAAALNGAIDTPRQNAMVITRECFRNSVASTLRELKLYCEAQPEDWGGVNLDKVVERLEAP